jgi:hypothetical protein
MAVCLQKNIDRAYVPTANDSPAAAHWALVSGWTPPAVGAELAKRHREFWNGARIQAFWAGAAFHELSEACELSYNLAEILVHLLGSEGAAFLAFLRAAHYGDAGQTAAVDCLGKCLGEVAGTFLGPGNWRPQRKAIKELLASRE